MRDEYLSFESCLSRLAHSFLREDVDYFAGYVDFQHPSIRDMLVTILKDEPRVRLRYIELLSARGLPAVLEGLRADQVGRRSHALSLVGDEMPHLIHRIEVMLQGPVRPDEIGGILTSAARLIPHKEGRRELPADLDLTALAVTPSGRALSSIVRGIGGRSFHAANTTHPVSVLDNVVTSFYELVPYIHPLPSLEYADELLSMLDRLTVNEAAHLALVLSRNKPQMFQQVYSSELDDRWHEAIMSDIEHAMKRGVAFRDALYDDFDVELEEYQNWRAEVESVLKVASHFYDISRHKLPGDLRRLRSLMEAIAKPERDDYEDEEDNDSGNHRGLVGPAEGYWSIPRLFEDL